MKASELSEGDLIVYTDSWGYTTTGRVVDVPPWTMEVGGETYTYENSVNVRTSPNLPSYTKVALENVVGFRETTEPEAEIHDWD